MHGDDGSITHDTVLLDGEIFECSYTKKPNCFSTDLARRWKKARDIGRYAVVSGLAA